MSRPETALITGASSGIGAELARCFAQNGSDVVLLARRADALESLARELEAAYPSTAHVLVSDLSEPGAASRIADRFDDAAISVDVLVNNAGFGARGRFADLDAQRQTDMIAVNVTALTDLSRRLLPGMLDRGRGGILNVASTAAFQPGPYMSVYYATKAYVLSFSEGLAEEVAGTGVTVSCLAPGPTDTAFADRADMRETMLFQLGATMEPATVAQVGYDGFRAGQPVVIPGAANQFMAFMTRFLPRSVARKIAGALQG